MHKLEFAVTGSNQQEIEASASTVLDHFWGEDREDVEVTYETDATQSIDGKLHSFTSVVTALRQG